MNITNRAAIVLQQIDEQLARIAVTTKEREQEFLNAIIEIRGNGRTLNTEEIARARIFYNAGASASRTGWPKTLRCLKTAIEGWITMAKAFRPCDIAEKSLAALCDQWEAGR